MNKRESEREGKGHSRLTSNQILILIVHIRNHSSVVDCYRIVTMIFFISETFSSIFYTNLLK